MPGEESRLEEIEEELEALRRRRAEFDGETERWKGERDRLNESARTLREEALRHREERDRTNRRAAALRLEIKSLRNELEAKRERLAEAEDELESKLRSLPPRREIEERLRRIDWEITTTPTADMIDREGALLEEARGLRSTLDAHARLRSSEEERLKTVAELKAIELRIRESREELSRLREEGDEHHERMILLLEKADEERGRADEAHTRFLERLSALKEVDEEIKGLAEEAGRVQEGLRRVERQKTEEKEKKVEVRRRELIAEARRKLDTGERLSLDEMKLLYSKEEGYEE